MKHTLLFVLFTILAIVPVFSQTDRSDAHEILIKARAKGDLFRTDGPTVRNHLTFSVNIIQLPINEAGIYVDYYFGKRHSIGFNIASVYANPAFKVFILSPDQGTYPGTVWNGTVGRINYKAYLAKDKRSYAGVTVIYKTLSYRNQSFVNVKEDAANTFVRSENAFLWGVDFVIGHHFDVPSSRINVELFCGGGYRYRERNYTTISSSGYNYGGPKPCGSFQLNQSYSTVVLGLKVGFKTFFGKKIT